jgi:hypothetical protein
VIKKLFEYITCFLFAVTVAAWSVPVCFVVYSIFHPEYDVYYGWPEARQVHEQICKKGLKIRQRCINKNKGISSTPVYENWLEVQNKKTGEWVELPLKRQIY